MRTFRLFALLYLLTSCEEKFDAPVPSEDTGLLVVEGVLTNERKRHLVKLSLPYPTQNAQSQPATGALVYVIEDSTVLSALTEFPSGSGNYYTQVGRAVAGKVYALFIEYKGREYFAQDSPAPVQPLQRLQYTASREGYTLALNPTGQDPNYIEHTINWQNTGACVAGEPCEGKVIFYDLKTIDVNEIYKPDKEAFFFPKQTTVFRKKYSVSPAYKIFLRSMLSETEWRGGVFDVQRENVPTNLSEGAVGFFAVCSVVQDSTLIE
ncbi:MAG: DUF4249 family protein [Cyclobacteriaceae bacterium]